MTISNFSHGTNHYHLVRLYDGLTLIDRDATRPMAIIFGGGRSSSLVWESISDDDILDTEFLLDRLTRSLLLGCSCYSWRSISCVYASVNSSQIGCNGIDLRYVLPFLSIQINKIRVSGVCEISKKLIHKNLGINPSFVPSRVHV